MHRAPGIGPQAQGPRHRAPGTGPQAQGPRHRAPGTGPQAQGAGVVAEAVGQVKARVSSLQSMDDAKALLAEVPPVPPRLPPLAALACFRLHSPLYIRPLYFRLNSTSSNSPFISASAPSISALTAPRACPLCSLYSLYTLYP
jgi:hypothetical protein